MKEEPTDSVATRNFTRSVSLDSVGSSGSRWIGTVNLSRNLSGLRVEGLPAVGVRSEGGEISAHKNFSRMSSKSSTRRSSISLCREEDGGAVDGSTVSQDLIHRIDSSLAQVGCRGNRVGRDDEEEDGFISVSDGELMLSFGSQHNEPGWPTTVTPLTEEIISPLPVDAMLTSKDKAGIQSNSSLVVHRDKLPLWLDYLSYLSHLAVFGILGVYSRYLLQKLFGPHILGLTGDHSPLYLDLPSNMLGSFLMGWFGLVFKADIHLVSDHLLVGLTTGYLGSLTTFSGWNQKMLELSSNGDWVFSVSGLIFGIFLVNYSIIVGVGCASEFRKMILNWFDKNLRGSKRNIKLWRFDKINKIITQVITMVLIWFLLWALSAVFFRNELDNLNAIASLWVAFLAGPPGVWLRWRLAKLNGQGLGKKGKLKWLPVGTLSANVFAACLMAALATISKEVNTQKCTIIISGIQLGFLGCLSTVSTFAAEIYGMWKAEHGWRAFIYIFITVVSSFILGTLIFSVPVWTKHYE